MVNITEIVTHGHMNATHTSNITAYYPPSNLPTPWPVLLISVLISLLISCCGFKAACLSLNVVMNTPRRLPKSPWQRKSAPIWPPTAEAHDTELERLHSVEAPKISGPPPPYDPGDLNPASDFADAADVQVPPTPSPRRSEELAENNISNSKPTEFPKWVASPARKVVDIIIILYSTFRAATCLIVALLAVLTKSHPTASPSNIFLILLSIQITLSNYAFPRYLRSLLTLDLLLAMIAFGIVSFSPFKSTSIPDYGLLAVTGGNCPVYTSNCISQMTHWTEVGCGNYTRLIDYYDGDNDDNDTPAPAGNFYEPYATSGSVNSMNVLHIIETIIFVFGAIWLGTALVQLYEIRHIISGKPSRRTTMISKCGGILLALLTIFGVAGAVIASFMTIGAHLNQELGNHHVMYMDSFGPPVRTNVTMGNVKHGTTIVASEYWGNSTNWSDCFTVEAPKSEDGWFSDWVHQNGFMVWRIAAGV